MIIKGTSNYWNINNGNLLSISGDKGKSSLVYNGNAYTKLAPTRELYNYYHYNPDKLTDLERIQRYIIDFYEIRLKKLNITQLLDELEQNFGNEIVLLCYEYPSVILDTISFCHRRLIADWIELETGIVIPELQEINEEIKEVDTYDLKPIIKSLIPKYK